MHPTAPVATLHERARDVAEALRERFHPILRDVAGIGLRPAALARELGVDRTLAARVLRAIRAADHVSVLHEIPAPGGLRMILDAARGRVDEARCEQAAEAVRRFERLIDEFPGGRSALVAALSDLDDRVLRRNVHSASQAIHKSMASILGYQADVMQTTILIHPASDGRTTDNLYLLGKYGVRRLRASSPVTVFGQRSDVTVHDRPSYGVYTLDGHQSPENGNAYLLHEFCTRPAPPLSLYHTESANLYTLSENVPAVNTPVSLVAGLMIRSSGLRYATESMAWQWESQVPRMPCRVLVNDVFVHRDVYPAPPVATSTLHTIATGPRRPDAPAFCLDNVDIRPALTPLGSGLDDAGCPDIPRYGDQLAFAFAKAGWNPADFRGYRCRVTYPVPLVSVTVWFELPACPAGDKGMKP